MNCYADEVLREDSEWIPLTTERIDALTFNDIKNAKHIRAVDQPIPAGLDVLTNTEFDSYSGACISGGGLGEVQETLRQAQADGFTRAIVILDGAYQFACSLGVYVPAKGGKYDTAKTVAA